MLAPTAQLRVYVPLDAYPSGTRSRWEAYVAGGQGLTRQQVNEERDRTAASLLLTGRLGATEAGALVRRAGRRRYICPLDVERRAADALRDLQAVVPPVALPAMLPDERERTRLERLGRHRVPPQIREHAWSVPLVWYLAFDPEEQRRTDAPEGSGPRVRFLTTVGQAVVRLEDVFDTLIGDIDLEIEAGPDEIDDLLTWLSAFDGDSLLELDYGRLAQDLPAARDHACADLWRAVEAFRDGDLFEAAVAYGVARTCWGALRDRASAS